MVKVKVDPGICGLETEVEAEVEEGGEVVALDIESECEGVEELADGLKEVRKEGLWNEDSFSGNPVYKAADEDLKHPTCPVPSAILKAVEAELGLALEEDVKIEFV